MITIEGLYGIRATILKHSVSAVDPTAEMLTYEVEYPRIVLSENNTHKMISKNSSSSRAIPFNKMLGQLTGRPVRFGQANPGMQDKGEDYDAGVEIPSHLYSAFNQYLAATASKVGLDKLFVSGKLLLTPAAAWDFSKFLNVSMSKAFFEAGYHKQVYNRLTEAYQMMKTVTSGTEWANFFWLRKDGAADPTIAELARVMYEAKQASVPQAQVLQPGEWHLPYVDTWCDQDNLRHYGDVMPDGAEYGWKEFTLEDAIKVSAARSAAVSFRNEDYGLDKCLEVHERLVGDERKHASAFEHQATPIERRRYLSEVMDSSYWEDGVSHMDSECRLWSGNLRGFVQYRKLIPGENYTGKI